MLMGAVALVALAGCGSEPAKPARVRPTPSPAKDYPVVIEIDGPKEDQIAVNSWIAKLQEGFDTKGDFAPSPYLREPEDDPYKGHVFWDADVWVFPGMALLDPTRVISIPKARLDGPVPVPWEMNDKLQDATPPVSQRQRSQTGTAYWMLNQSYALGLISKEARDDFRKKAAEYYRSIATKTPRGYEILDVKSIDEYSEQVNNELYTNLVAQMVVGEPFYLPRDAESFLTFEKDTFRPYKQAAAVLSIFPLQFPKAEAEAQIMMERFPPKTNPRGPAMSDSAHATIYARIGQVEKAYETWRQGWGDFQRVEIPHVEGDPFDFEVFSEHRTRKRSYFLTGAGGCLNTVIYGFCGFRIDSQKQPGAAWTKQLNGGYWLSIKPQLPSQWRSITVPFTLLGKKYTLVATHEKVSVNQGDP